MRLRALFVILCLAGLLADPITLKGDNAKTFSGIGVIIRNDVPHVKTLSDHAIVVSLVPDSPAEKIGIQQEDKIIQVDDINFSGKTLDDVIKLIDGPVGTKVKIIVIRAGSPGALTFTVTRATLAYP